jgi:hypothetical protein
MRHNPTTTTAGTALFSGDVGANCSTGHGGLVLNLFIFTINTRGIFLRKDVTDFSRNPQRPLKMEGKLPP